MILSSRKLLILCCG